MSGNQAQADANLLSAIALTIGGAVGVAPSFDHRDHLDLFLTVLRPSTGSSQARFHRPEGPPFGKA